MKYIIEIFVAVINGTFILIAAVKGASIFSKKNQMRRYSVELEHRELHLRTVKQLLEKNFRNMVDNCEIPSDNYENYQYVNKEYWKQITEYNALITEINLFCGANIVKPKFFYPKFDEAAGTIDYEPSSLTL